MPHQHSFKSLQVVLPGGSVDKDVVEINKVDSYALKKLAIIIINK